MNRQGIFPPEVLDAWVKSNFRGELFERGWPAYDFPEYSPEMGPLAGHTLRASIQMATQNQRIQFLCTGNCIRSQMAEGWLRHLADNRCESLSAGASPVCFIHRHAIAVMHEMGIDIAR